MISSNLQGCQFSDSQKSRVQAAKLSHVAVAGRKDFDFLMLMNSVFRVRIVEIWVKSYSNAVD